MFAADSSICFMCCSFFLIYNIIIIINILCLSVLCNSVKHILEFNYYFQGEEGQFFHYHFFTIHYHQHISCCFVRHFEFSSWLPLYTSSQAPVPGSPFPVPGISNIRIKMKTLIFVVFILYTASLGKLSSLFKVYILSKGN